MSIELDSGLVPILSETLAEFDNVKIIEGDALKLNLAEIIKTEFGGKGCLFAPIFLIIFPQISL